MAKKKPKLDVELEEEIGSSESIVTKKLIEKYGDTIKTGTQVLNNINSLMVHSVSPALDLMLGGGFREGSMVIMTSDPKAGKTTTALHFAAKMQKQGKTVVYANTEGRLSKQNFTGIKDLDPDKIIVVESTDERILTAEDFLSIIEGYINSVPGCVIIVDSTSNMIPKDELEGELTSKVRNQLPKLLALFCRRVSGTLMKNKIICIMITHNIANTSGMGHQTKLADGGNMIRYQAGTNAKIGYTRAWCEGGKEDGIQIGQMLMWNLITSNAGGTPGSEATGWLRYGIGIDEVKEIIELAKEFNFIKAAGAWYTIKILAENKEEDFVKEYLESNSVDLDDEKAVLKAFQFQGEAKLYAFLEARPVMSAYIYKKLRELLY
jgi:recombination protein RecA